LCAGFKRRSPIHPPLGVLSSGIRARFLKFESNNSRRSWPEKIHTKVLRRTKGKEGEMHKEDDNAKFDVSDCSKKSGDHKKKSKSKSKSKRIVIESSSSSTSSSDEGSIYIKKRKKKKSVTFNYSRTPFKYDNMSSNNNFLSVFLGKPPHFDGTNYSQWRTNMR
jgi:hypothetical protein